MSWEYLRDMYFDMLHSNTAAASKLDTLVFISVNDGWGLWKDYPVSGKKKDGKDIKTLNNWLKTNQSELS